MLCYLQDLILFFVIWFFIIVAGLGLGSFFYALAHRLVRGESIARGRSKCPDCEHTLGGRDLVPVFSWFFLRGKCRYCGKKISWQYPLAEIITAVCFAWLYFGFGLSESFFFTLLVTCFLIPIFITDSSAQVIPDSLSLSGVVIIFGAQWWRGADLANIMVAILIGGGFFLLQYLISRGEWIGAGDIRLGILMGVALGFPRTIVALAIAYIGGAVIALILIGLSKKQHTSRMPFGTFLTVATFLTLLYGNTLVNWYLGLMDL